jgi:hypothetical protein
MLPRGLLGVMIACAGLLWPAWRLTVEEHPLITSSAVKQRQINFREFFIMLWSYLKLEKSNLAYFKCLSSAQS